MDIVRRDGLNRGLASFEQLIETVNVPLMLHIEFVL
jgi:hypothetical protein